MTRGAGVSPRFIGLTLLISGLAFAGAVHAEDGAIAFIGARLIDGTGAPAMEGATLLIQDGRVLAVGRQVRIPRGAERIDARGKTIIPGLINAHGHVSNAGQLGKYLRDGITTVLSLGGTQEFNLRTQCRNAEAGTVPRLYVAGPIEDSTSISGSIVVKTPEEARSTVDELVTHKPDIVKVRIDDFLGARSKMSPEVYGAAIAEAHKNGFRVAVHVVRLEDALGALHAGADYIAHSIRDCQVNAEFIQLMQKRSVSYCPTLTREVAVFTYTQTPDFFRDPFFLKEADRGEMLKLENPAAQEGVRHDRSAEWYKEHFPIAMRNLKMVSDAHINIAMGTDSGGGPGRFQGYFEHLELEYEVKAGLTPMQALVTATSGAAKALNHDSEIGSLESGKAADFLILDANPLEDIRNTREINAVWVAGRRVKSN